MRRARDQLVSRSCSNRYLPPVESVSKSPIFSVFGEALQGVATIRAYGDASRFMTQIFSLLDANNRPFFNLCEIHIPLASWPEPRLILTPSQGSPTGGCRFESTLSVAWLRFWQSSSSRTPRRSTRPWPGSFSRSRSRSKIVCSGLSASAQTSRSKPTRSSGFKNVSTSCRFSRETLS